MIIVNLYCEEDYNPNTDGFHLKLAGVINDEFDLYDDTERVVECIENDSEFEPKAGQFYEIQLIRATIASAYPIFEPAFAIDRIIEKKYCNETGVWVTPLVRM